MTARVIATVLLLGAAALPASAGGGEPRADPCAVAHYAAKALAAGDAGAVPHLRAWLAESVTDEKTDDATYVARMVVLDALVGLSARVPADEILPHLGGGGLAGAAALALGIQQNDDGILLAMLDRYDGVLCEEAWLAVGNRLLARRTPGFGRRLLERLTVRLIVLADDREEPGARWREAGGSICWDGFLRVPEGFPPVPVRGAWPADLGGDVVIPGPRPVALSRGVATEGVVGFGGTGPFDEWDEARLEWLAALLGEEVAALGVEARTSRSVAYGSAVDFRRRVVASCDAERAKVLALADRCVRAGILSPEDRAGLVPRLRVKVIDRRAQPRRPLPEVPEAGLSRSDLRPAEGGPRPGSRRHAGP